MKKQILSRGAAVLAAAVMTASLAAAMPISVSAEVTGDTARLLADMGAGWNLGNTLDATGGSGLSSETSWGNPKTTKAMVEAIHDAGFNTIRIPVSWGRHTSGSDFTIDAGWMARVKEVVDYAYDDGMYVILNTHHDNSSASDSRLYYYPDSAHKDASLKYLNSVWAQVAEEFKDYDEHLIFETLNEPRLVGTSDEWWFNVNSPNAAVSDSISAINTFNQEIVNTVRATGSNNSTRYIMCPGYAASVDGAVTSGYKLPTDPNSANSGRLLVSTHAYTPYNLCLGGASYTAFDNAGKTELNNMFKRLDDKFLSKGIGVVMGEMGISNKDNNDARTAWAAHYYGLSKQYGVPCLIWDNNVKVNASNAGEAHWHFNRKTLKWGDPDVINAIMNAMGVTNVSIPADDDVTTKKTQTITGTTSYTKTYGNAAFTLDAKNGQSDGGALSYFSSNTSVATLTTSGKVTIKGAGTATITVTAAETSKYKSAQMKITLKVNPQTISNAVISDIADQVYTGGAIKPAITVKSGSKSITSSNYTVTYTNNTNVGKATVKVTFKNNYKGTASADFNIIPKAPSAADKVSATANAVRINWNKVPGATGYRVYRYNTSTKKWDLVSTIKNGSTTTYRDGSRSAGTRYAYRVKAYQKVNGVNYWSKATTLYAASKPVQTKIKSYSRSTGAIRINWNSVKCDGYEVYICNSADGSYKLAGTADSSATTFRISGLKSATSYKVKFRAFVKDKSGRKYNGAFSSVLTIKTK